MPQPALASTLMGMRTRQDPHSHRTLFAALAATLLVGACAADPASAPSVTTPVPGPTGTRTASVAGTTAAAPPVTRTAAPPTRPRPAGLPRCRSVALAVSLGPAEAAAGSLYRPLLFRNNGPTACELRGFPGVSYVAGDNGRQIGRSAQETGGRGSAVRIPSGGSAEAVLQLVRVGNFDPAACRPTPVRGLRVYPPGETAAVFVPEPGTGCAGSPPDPQLLVRTLTARR
jgi:hypothetical protein